MTSTVTTRGDTTLTNPADVAEITATLAAVRAELAALAKTVDGVRHDIRDQGATFVPRQEWELSRREYERLWTSLHDHESRLRLIERKVWAAAGIATFLGAGLGVLLDTIISYTQR